jgi:hypothetical protein
MIYNFMEKYGYKNISSRNEFEKASKNNGRINYGPVKGKNLTTYDFIDWTTQGNFGMPGQTRYFVKNVEDLTKANDKASSAVISERKPKGYVGW